VSELFSTSTALATLIGLTAWARAVPTRAWGDGTLRLPLAGLPRTLAVVLATVALQAAAAIAASGLAAGVALVATSWMALGWLLVLSMNLWPAAALTWARWLGALGGAGCVLGLGLRWAEPWL